MYRTILHMVVMVVCIEAVTEQLNYCQTSR